ncbi:hypothetical protein N656DRAFT_205238 [Canariomyces notabilis]|uniref:Uncharacterized protein n=1 Tax=Canariomyces notabilis TaxID=2074819 RepID=A0AAN6QPZ2_9PEZI|nr:hypothetical protein N656DRAFT_205238 [Canariomyces arenarius]
MTPDMHAAILQPRCPMVQTGPDENGREGVGAEVHTMESSTNASGVLGLQFHATWARGCYCPGLNTTLLSNATQLKFGPLANGRADNTIHQGSTSTHASPCGLSRDHSRSKCAEEPCQPTTKKGGASIQPKSCWFREQVEACTQPHPARQPGLTSRHWPDSLERCPLSI